MLKSFLSLPVFCLALCAPTAFADTFYSNAAAFAAATSGTTTVDFGTTQYAAGYTTGSLPGASFSTGGVTIGSAASTININNANYYQNHGGFSAYPGGNYLIVFGSAPTDTFTITFPSSTAVAFSYGGTFAGISEFITATLSNGDSLMSTTFDSATSGNPLSFFGVTSSVAITSITFTAQDDGSSHYGTFDNIIYGSAAAAATPEPSSIALLGTGIFSAFGVARRRYRRG